MKKVLTLAAALMVFGASASMAQGGLNLFWDGCSDGGTTSKTWVCNANTGAVFAAYASVVLPGDMPLFTGTTAIIDISVDGAALPAWWQTQAGQCRQNALGLSFDPSSFVTNCFADLWGGAAPTAVLAIQPGVNGANKVRVNGAAALPAGSELNLVADGTEYLVARMTITRAKSTGTGSCAGCLDGACIVLNECKLQQPGGVGDRTVNNPAAGNFITWQAGSQLCPQATPAQNRTWGAVKNLYR